MCRGSIYEGGRKVTLGDLFDVTDNMTHIKVWDDEKELFTVSTNCSADYLFPKHIINTKIISITVAIDGRSLKATIYGRYNKF